MHHCPLCRSNRTSRRRDHYHCRECSHQFPLFVPDICTHIASTDQPIVRTVTFSKEPVNDWRDRKNTLQRERRRETGQNPSRGKMVKAAGSGQTAPATYRQQLAREEMERRKG